jgi:hypothetical protein
MTDSNLYGSLIYEITSGTTNRANNLYITFLVDDLPADCVAWQIVRGERKAEDRTVVAQGLIGAARKYAGTSIFYCPTTTLSTIKEYALTNQPRGGGLVLEQKLVEFISPEVSYNKNLSYVGGDTLEFCGIATLAHKFGKSNNTYFLFMDDKNRTYSGDIEIVVDKVNDVEATPATNPRRAVINDCKIVPATTIVPTSETITGNSVLVGSYNFENYIRKFNTENIQGFHGTVAVISLDSALSVTGITDSSYNFGTKYMLCNYKRSLVPYGGNSYEARSSRSYIPCSIIREGLGLGYAYSILVKEGDTFISKFEYQRAMASGLTGGNGIIDETLVEAMVFPVETSINTRWQYNKTFTQTYTNAAGWPINLSAVIMQETAGVYDKVYVDTTIPLTSGYTANFTQVNNLYSYNSVYSKQNNITRFYPEPLDINNNKEFDTRVLASDTKINGELSDSWTKWRVNNFIDVDSTYGPITNMLLFNNELLFWQDKAFGQLSVNQRSLLQDNNPGALTLGTGGILDRFDYISNTCGNISERGVIKSNNGLYWLDTLNTTLYRYSGQLEPLSKTKGLQSYLNTFVDKTTKCIGGVYDSKYTEVNMTLLNGSAESTTLTFSELLNNFSPFQTFYPTQYINLFDGTYNTTTDNRTVYLHNYGNKSTFYGTIYPSKVRFVVNDNYDYTKVFDSIEYKSRSYNGTVLLFSDTFNTLKIWNDKQYTGEVSIVMDSNITKREQGYSMIVPRNVVNSNIETDLDIFNVSNHDTNRLFKERIRDKYSIVELKYNNTNGYTFSVPYVKTNYRISSR